jgi:hypothetical protein
MRSMEQETPNTSSVAVEARQVVGQAVDQARQQGMSQLATQKDRIAGTLGNVADALHVTSRQLKQSEDIPVGDVVDQMASSVEQFSDYIRERNVDELIGEAERQALRRPWLFLGGAFAVGLVAARFLKSSHPDPTPSTSYPASYPAMDPMKPNGPAASETQWRR